jgi:RNA polymerase-binding transcription factor DksA
MAKVKTKPKMNGKPKPKAAPPAKAAKSSTGKVEKAKKTTAIVKKPVKPATGRIENSSPLKKTEKPATATIKNEKAPSATIKRSRTERIEQEDTGTKAVTRPPKSERFERSSKIPVVDRASLTGLTSPFDRKEIKEWRQVLINKRNEITNDIAGLVKDAMEAEDGHTTPNHIAERGSDADLQEFSLGMAGEEKVELWLIDRALRKIDESQPVPFGLCEYNKKPIQRSRLELLPWTPLSIDGAQYMEENNLTLEDMLIDD